MKDWAVDFLVCPACRTRLSLVDVSERHPGSTGGEEIVTGRLDCSSCRKSYPILRGVPRFVDTIESTATNIETGRRFGQAWKEFPRLDAAYEQQFFDWLSPVGPDFLSGKLVLEAGCGKGRHAAIVSRAGAKAVFAVDIGDAVDVAYKNAGQLPGVVVVQADIRNLPFSNQFDFAFSVGVLHHIDDPGEGFSAMSRTVKPDGAVLAWVYGLENNWWLVHLVDPLRIAITSKMAVAPLRLLSGLLALNVYSVSRYIYVPYAALRKHLSFLPELFYSRYLTYIARFDFNEIHHIVFDHLVTPVASYLPKGEVQSWFEKENWDNPVLRWHNCNSWTAFAFGKKAERGTVRERGRELAGQPNKAG